MTKHFFISEHFLGKKGQSYRYTWKLLSTFIFTLVDIAKIPQKLNYRKMDISWLC
jgi:hypothetical protein